MQRGGSCDCAVESDAYDSCVRVPQLMRVMEWATTSSSDVQLFVVTLADAFDQQPGTER